MNCTWISAKEQQILSIMAMSRDVFKHSQFKNVFTDHDKLLSNRVLFLLKNLENLSLIFRGSGAVECSEKNNLKKLKCSPFKYLYCKTQVTPFWPAPIIIEKFYNKVFTLVSEQKKPYLERSYHRHIQIHSISFKDRMPLFI